MTDPPPAFTCPICGRGSWNPEDARQRFCGHCKFVDDVPTKRGQRVCITCQGETAGDLLGGLDF